MRNHVKGWKKSAYLLLLVSVHYVTRRSDSRRFQIWHSAVRAFSLLRRCVEAGSHSSVSHLKLQRWPYWSSKERFLNISRLMEKQRSSGEELAPGRQASMESAFLQKMEDQYMKKTHDSSLWYRQAAAVAMSRTWIQINFRERNSAYF